MPRLHRSVMLLVLLLTTLLGAMVAQDAVALPALPAIPAMPDMPAMPAAIGGSSNIQFGAAAPTVPAATAVSAAFDCMARTGSRSHSNWSRSNDNGRPSWIVSVSANGCSAEVHAEGAITFNRNASGLESITQGGWFEATERTDAGTRRLEARPENGALKYSYSVAGNQRPFDTEAQTWFAAFLLGLERETGFAAEVRVPELLKSGGPNAVLDEIARISGDFAKARYFTVLFKSAKLEGPQVRRALETAGKTMHSDFELARVLIALQTNYDLADEGARSAYLNAANQLKSDFEHSRVLIELLKMPKLSTALVNGALQSAGNIRSDFERSRILTTMARYQLVDGANADAFVEAASGIRSDFERSRTLTAALDATKLSDATLIKIIAATGTMHSDFEVARILSNLSSRYSLAGAVRDAYVKRAEAIHSQFERQRALNVVGVRRATM